MTPEGLALALLRGDELPLDIQKMLVDFEAAAYRRDPTLYGEPVSPCACVLCYRKLKVCPLCRLEDCTCEGTD